MKRFYIVEGYYESGPFTIHQLIDRRIQKDTVLRNERTGIRMFARDIPEIFSKIKSQEQVKNVESISQKIAMKIIAVLKQIGKKITPPAL